MHVLWDILAYIFNRYNPVYKLIVTHTSWVVCNVNLDVKRIKSARCLLSDRLSACLDLCLWWWKASFGLSSPEDGFLECLDLSDGELGGCWLPGDVRVCKASTSLDRLAIISATWSILLCTPWSSSLMDSAWPSSSALLTWWPRLAGNHHHFLLVGCVSCIFLP